MQTQTILVVVGTRPDAIKMAPVIRELSRRPEVTVTTCVTGQHRYLLDQALASFDITPEIDLDLMRHDQTLADLSAAVLIAITGVIARVRPDIILVHGDTTTAMAVALAAFYVRVPIAHVEAGLRTGEISSPFPEELNRRVVGLVARFHFAPTADAKDALLAEGVDPRSVFVTGNTIVDAVRQTLANPSVLQAADSDDFDGDPLVVVTAHRRESHGVALVEICSALREVAATTPGIRIVFPVHPNPRVQEIVYRALSSVDGISLIEPLPYPAFVRLLSRAALVLTDSGGVQEEALALSIPTLILRECTERPEVSRSGIGILVGTDRRTIVAAARDTLAKARRSSNVAHGNTALGDGHAAERIANILIGVRASLGRCQLEL